MRRLDTGNRAFRLMVAVALTVRLTVIFFTCCVAITIARLVTTEGWASLNHWPLLAPATALVVVSSVGLLLGLVTLLRAARAVRAFSRAVRSDLVPAPRTVRLAAARAGLAGRVDVVTWPAPFALTYGLVRPRVLISERLVTDMGPQELDAVLAHEREHVRSGDPRKLLACRALPVRQFYLPVLRDLHERFVAGRELAADRSAVASCGRTAVVGALLKATECPRMAATPAAAMASSSFLTERITQLENGTEPRLAWADPRHLALTVLSSGALAWGLAASALLLMNYPSACMNLLR